jgi:hypothetical protein
MACAVVVAEDESGTRNPIHEATTAHATGLTEIDFIAYLSETARENGPSSIALS